MFIVPQNYDGGLYFLNGKRTTVACDAGQFPVNEPRTGAVVAECPSASEVVVDSAVKDAAAAQKKWAALTAHERGRVLHSAASLIREELARDVMRVCGKTLFEARLEIALSADTLDYFGGIAPILQGETFDLPGGPQTRFAYTRREPFGVVGCIGVWNYPFALNLWKVSLRPYLSPMIPPFLPTLFSCALSLSLSLSLFSSVAPALAAGNAVVLKPSPFAPGSAVVLGEILAAAGLPAGVFNVVQGEAATGDALCKHELIRKVSFTGSLATGCKVQAACAAYSIKPVTLELGGKSALVISDDSDVKSAVSAAMRANFFNQGQVCKNASRVFVQRAILTEFTRSLLEECDARLIVGDPFNEKTRVGATINELHMNRVLDYIESAKKEGGQVLRGGVRVHPPGVEGGFYLEPAVISGLTDSARAAREEIFGAVLLLLPFDTEEELSDCETENLARGHRVAALLESGTVFINTYGDTGVDVPLGGYKNSGYGHENCVETLKAYSQIKTTYVNVQDSLANPF